MQLKPIGSARSFSFVTSLGCKVAASISLTGPIIAESFYFHIGGYKTYMIEQHNKARWKRKLRFKVNFQNNGNGKRDTIILIHSIWPVVLVDYKHKTKSKIS